MNYCLLQKKSGKHPHPQYLCDRFKDFLHDHNMRDLGFIGPPFTWEKWRGTNAWVEKRLDHAIALVEWFNLFNQSRVIHISHAFGSNHTPIFLELRKYVNASKKRVFRFENSWVQEAECEGIIRSIWGRLKGFELLIQLVACGEELEKWGRALVKGIKGRIDIKKNESIMLKAAEKAEQ